MDFARVEFSDDDQAFLDEARTYLSGQVTEDVRLRDRETSDNFDEGVHLALGAAGYLAAEWKPERDGGFGRVRGRLWQLEKRRAQVPWVTSGTTSMIARSVAKFGSPELQAEVMPRVFSGHVRLCLGYTEPEGGSDIATCKTRAVRDGGGGWVINGSKMFTTRESPVRRRDARPVATSSPSGSLPKVPCALAPRRHRIGEFAFLDGQH
jgi:alkylation response protein AidB-like acyl-CoA dehydrogenase